MITCTLLGFHDFFVSPHLETSNTFSCDKQKYTEAICKRGSQRLFELGIMANSFRMKRINRCIFFCFLFTCLQKLQFVKRIFFTVTNLYILHNSFLNRIPSTFFNHIMFIIFQTRGGRYKRHTIEILTISVYRDSAC